MMREFMRKAQPWAAFLVVSVFLTGCGDDDPSRPDFSVETLEQTADAAEAVVAPVEANAVLGANLQLAFNALMGQGSAIATLSPLVPFEVAGQMGRMSMRGLPTRAASAPTGVLLPDEIMGLTFAWSVDSAGYVVSDASGAPSNGVRFVYYAVDPFSGMPVEPLNPLGYLQLVDASTDVLARLEIEAVRTAGTVTLADYFVQGSFSGNLSTLTISVDAEGFISDGSERVDFDIDFGETQTSSSVMQTINVDIVNDGDDAAIRLDFLSSGNDVESEEEGAFIVEHGNNDAVFEFTGDSDYENDIYTIDGALRFNGAEVVLFSGDANAPEFTRPDGGNLTSVELNALGRVWVAFVTTQFFVAELMLPFILLLALSGV